MRPIAYVLIGTCMMAIAAAQAETRPLTGRFQGSGRACYGTLDVRTKTISWLTTFSQCNSTPYELIERNEQGEELRMTYRLKPGTDTCRYAILSLTHAGVAENTGWDVTGYGSEQSYQTDKASGYKAKAEDMMSCYLTRDPGKGARTKR
jgi:hypothetical protein